MNQEQKAEIAPCRFGDDRGWRISIPIDATVEVQYRHSRFFQLRPHPESSYGIDQRGDIVDVLRADLAQCAADRDRWINSYDSQTVRVDTLSKHVTSAEASIDAYLARLMKAERGLKAEREKWAKLLKWLMATYTDAREDSEPRRGYESNATEFELAKQSNAIAHAVKSVLTEMARLSAEAGEAETPILNAAAAGRFRKLLKRFAR